MIEFLCSRSTGNLFTVGVFSISYGIYLIKRGIEGDTWMAGTNFTYPPRWLLISFGLLLQLALAAVF